MLPSYQFIDEPAFQSMLEKEALSLALREDIGNGDITTKATIPKDAFGHATLLFKSEGILAGERVAHLILDIAKFNGESKWYKHDGDEIQKGEIVAHIQGFVCELLCLERVILNFLQHMSGIATKTRAFVRAIEGTNTKILDTRKTSPCLRMFDKEAARIGGALNHRMGLYDMILIKDNHINAAGSPSQALSKTQHYLAHLAHSNKYKIEIEVRNMSELHEVLTFTPAPDVIMLDNFSLETLTEAVALARQINPNIKIEVSGGVLHSVQVKQIAKTGVDYISVGALTHSFESIDISMKIKPERLWK